MRSYPLNSPQAAARIVALAMLADGDLAKAEFDALDDLGADVQLGLGRAELHAITYAICDDLMCTMRLTWADACRVDPRTLAQLMAEVDDPGLRLKVLRLCIAVVEADRHVAEGESIVVAAAVEHWGMQREMLRTDRPPMVSHHG